MSESTFADRLDRIEQALRIVISALFVPQSATAQFRSLENAMDLLEDAPAPSCDQGSDKNDTTLNAPSSGDAPAQTVENNYLVTDKNKDAPPRLERLKTVTYEELLHFVRRIASFKDLPSGLDPSLIPGIVGWASGIVQAAEENNVLGVNKNRDAPPREEPEGKE